MFPQMPSPPQSPQPQSPQPQSPQPPQNKSGMTAMKRFALVAGLLFAATGAGASTALLTSTTAFAQQPPGLSTQPYQLRCWQDSVQILSIREPQALQSLA